MPARKLLQHQNRLVSSVMSHLNAGREAAGRSEIGGLMRGHTGFAVALSIGAATALGAFALVASASAEPLILTLIAFLASVGVFFLLGLLAGHTRIGPRQTATDIARFAADTVEDGLQVTSRSGHVVYSNAALALLVGRKDGGDINSLDDRFGTDPAAAEALFRLHRAAERAEIRSEDIKVPGLPTDGQPTWLRISVRPVERAGLVPDRSGLALWRISDITAARAAEEEARRQVTAAVGSLDEVPAGVLVADDDGRVTHINATLKRWLQVPAGENSREITLTDFMSSESAALLGAQAREARSSAVRCDVDLVRQGGLGFPASAIVSARGAGGLAAVVLDRADGARAAGSAGSSALGAVELFNEAPLGIATLSPEGTVVAANSAFSRLLLQSRIPAEARAGDLIARGTDAATRRRVDAAIAEALKGTAKIAPVELTVGPQKEFTRRLYAAGLPSGGEREAAVLYMIDATEQKALEQKFAQSQKMEAIGKLAGGIAHDFNNELTAIIGWSDLLLQTQLPGDPGFKSLINVKSSAQRAAALVHQLLAFSRQQTLQAEVLQLGETLTDLSVLLNRLLGEKIDLKIHQGRDLWYVKADRSQFGQVIINLAVNARDAMPDGGKLIMRTRNITERESRKLEGHGVAIGEYVMVEVEDTGTGMPPEVLAKIFEPFFTTKGIGKGTGLGLSTVYGIVKQTGGYVLPESTPGKGTTFRVYLPRHAHEPPAEENSEAKAPRKERTQDLTGTGRVLLVEDEDAVRNFAAEALRRQGYEVVQASTGQEALELMVEQGFKVDIVVSDVIMPEMDGPTLLKQLRRHRPDLKFIFVSGYPDDAFKTSLEPDTPFAFLQKPFSLVQLAAKVKTELLR